MEFFEIFPWDKNFETGLPVVDEQHRKLVEILNRLAAHLANRSQPVMLNQIFDELAAYADYHFKTEEEIWSKSLNDDEWFKNHEHTHHTFIEKVVQLRQEEGEKPLDDVIQDIVSFLSKWLAYHILDSDKRMAKAVLAVDEGLSVADAKERADREMSGSMQVLIDTVLKMYDSLSSRTLDLMREKSLRKQAEEALQQSEERWKFLLEADGEAVWDWTINDEKGSQSSDYIPGLDIVTSASDETEDEIRVHPADIEKLKSDLQDHLDGKTEFYINKHRVLRANGSWSWVISRGKVVGRDEAGHALRMVGTHTDVTERELASILFKNSSQAMFVTDNENRMISVNPAFTNITGYSVDECIGQTPDFLSSGRHDEAYFKNMWRVLEQDGYWSGEIINQKKNGDHFTASLTLNAVKSPDGEVDHYIALFLDITDRKRAEAALRRSQKMETVGQLTGGIAHDFNNLLGVILGSIELLEHKLEMNEKVQKRFDAMKKAGKRAAVLSRQLLSFSRHQPEAIENVNINELMADMDSLISRSLTPEVEVIEKLEKELWHTNINAGDFEDALLNIIINARDAMDGKGQLIKETANVSFTANDCDNVTGCRAGDYVCLKISDTGSGMTAEMMEHIFEPFYTTKEAGKGTGLGLAMTYSFVQRSGGFITVRSELGKGTTFEIYLPKADANKVELQDDKAEATDLPGGNETILVVDDEPGMLSVTEDSLTGMGYTVLTAEDGKAALEILQQDKSIALIVSDMVMPGGLSGIELNEQAQKVIPGIKVILTSGYIEKVLSQKDHNLDESRLLSKPYTQVELANKVREILDR